MAWIAALSPSRSGLLKFCLTPDILPDTVVEQCMYTDATVIPATVPASSSNAGFTASCVTVRRRLGWLLGRLDWRDEFTIIVTPLPLLVSVTGELGMAKAQSAGSSRWFAVLVHEVGWIFVS